MMTYFLDVLAEKIFDKSKNILESDKCLILPKTKEVCRVIEVSVDNKF
jgi:hypothetical protein